MEKRKILMIGYNFFGYELEIIEELKKNYEVEFIDISMNFIEKGLLRVVNLFLKKYFFDVEKKLIEKKTKLLKNINKEETIYIVFVLGCWYNPSPTFFSYIDKNLKIEKKILYIWDTVRGIRDFNNYRKNFDEVFSFDKEESEKYNLVFRPTFYSKRLRKLKKIKVEEIYEISFIGGFTEERYTLIKKYISIFSKKYIYIFVPSIKEYSKMLFNCKYDLKMIFPFIVKKEKYNKILYKSKIILDLVRFNQTGLTQRIFDALYLQKKIITTSTSVKNYDFYNSNNILVINENTTSKEIEDFKRKEYIEIDKKIIDYYSIERWGEDIFK